MLRILDWDRARARFLHRLGEVELHPPDFLLELFGPILEFRVFAPLLLVVGLFDNHVLGSFAHEFRHIAQELFGVLFGVEMPQALRLLARDSGVLLFGLTPEDEFSIAGGGEVSSLMLATFTAATNVGASLSSLFFLFCLGLTGGFAGVLGATLLLGFFQVGLFKGFASRLTQIRLFPYPFVAVRLLLGDIGMTLSDVGRGGILAGGPDLVLNLHLIVLLGDVEVIVDGHLEKNLTKAADDLCRGRRKADPREPFGAYMPRKGQPPVIIGHRGHADALENTLISFREAIAQGAQMLELDVRLSKDLIPMVCHDATIKRISGKRGSIADRTAKYLLSLDLGKEFRFVTLEATLRDLAPVVPINIELKFQRPDYRPLVTAVCEVIRKLDVAPRILVSSFFHASLDVVKRNIPELSVAPLFGRLTGPPHEDDLEIVFAHAPQTYPAEIFPFRGRCAVVSWKMIDAELAERFERGDGTLLTYTVDDPVEMKRLIDLGIDGIITNRPSVAKKVLSELF